MIRRSTICQKIFYLAVVTLFLAIPTGFTAPKKTVALLPLAVFADPAKAYLNQGVRTMLLSRLSGEGIEVISDQKIETSLDEPDKKGITAQDRAEKLARSLQADCVVFGSFTALSNTYSLDLSILDLTQEPAKLTRISEPAAEDQFIPRLSEIAYQFRSIIEGREIGPPSSETQIAQENAENNETTEMGKTRSLKPAGNLPLNQNVVGFDVIDLDKDGQPEWLVLTRENLFIYNRKSGNLNLKVNRKTVFGESFLKLSTGDYDNDGKPELFLNGLYGLSVRTTIFAWDGSLKKINQMDGHVRALKYPNKENCLVLFQDSQYNHFYYKKIHTMKTGQDGKLIKNDEIKLPREARFYTLSLIDLNNDDKITFAGLGKNSRLYIWDMAGNEIWNGDETLGNTQNAVALKQVSSTKDDIGIRFEIESPLLVADLDHDGKNELLAVKNIPTVEIVRDFKQYATSQLVVYKIGAAGLNLSWVSREVPYCMMDLAANGKTVYMAVAKSKMTVLTPSSSRIMWFE